jgi:hypothetical protein
MNFVLSANFDVPLAPTLYRLALGAFSIPSSLFLIFRAANPEPSNINDGNDETHCES